MPFTPKTAKEAGKKSNRRGVPNKGTSEMRDAFQVLIEKNLPKMNRMLNKVAKEDPAKALDLIHKFSDFFLPKLSRTEVENVTSLEQLLAMTPEERTKRINEIRSIKNQK